MSISQINNMIYYSSCLLYDYHFLNILFLSKKYTNLLNIKDRKRSREKE